VCDASEEWTVRNVFVSYAIPVSEVSGLTDEELLAAAGRGDGEAFGQWYELRHGELMGFFVRRTADAQLAADLTSETFAEAFVARRRFQSAGEGSARSWLFGIARHQLGQYARRRRVSSRYRRKLGVERTVVDDDAVERIEALADLTDLRDLLRDALASLPAPQVEAIRLRVIDELPYAEVARRLGCSEGAARVRVTRGLCRLAEVLAP
jgi:RNA polymerase sigma-70 factor (ECF subfamily)